MSNTISKKLTPSQVKVYEEASGLETTGDVIITQSSDAVFDIISNLLETK